MIILHNSLDEESRDFVAAHEPTLGGFTAGVATTPDGKTTVYDWYKGGRDAFWAAGHTDKVSAFPSVIVDIPTHRVPPTSESPGHTAPRRQHALRKPADMAEVMDFLTEINVELAKSAGEGLAVAPLTLDNMSDVKT